MVDQLARIESEARTLARSGNYLSARSIEAALAEKGFLETARVFRNRWTCSELDRLCQQAMQEGALQRECSSGSRFTLKSEREFAGD
jgi:hypothetical protein